VLSSTPVKSTVTAIAPVAPEPTTLEVAVAPQEPSQNVCSEPVIAAVEEPARVEDTLEQLLLVPGLFVARSRSLAGGGFFCTATSGLRIEPEPKHYPPLVAYHSHPV